MSHCIRLFAALGLLLVLASCNSLSKEECAAADWRVVGETDGAAGYEPQERFANHVKSCAKIKITPDQTVWYEGFQAGVVRYCTPLNGLSRGEAGDGYHSVCPPQAEPGFLRGYGLGKRAYDLRSRLNSLQSSISYKESEIDRILDEMKTAAEADRRDMRERADREERELRRLRREADDVGYELSGVERDIDWFRQSPDTDPPPRS